MSRTINYDLHEKVLNAYDPTKSADEIADSLSIKATQVFHILRCNKLPVHGVNYTIKNNDMEKDVIERFTSGQTLREIGEVYGFSREYIRQILKAYNLTGRGFDGGLYKKSKEKKEKKDIEKLDKYNNYILPWWGCTRAIRDSIPLDVQIRFKEQKNNQANHKSNLWDLSLPEWWELWKESGKWDYRGKDGYVMTRKDFNKPWTKENVQIAYFQEAIRLRDKFKKSTLAKRE